MLEEAALDKYTFTRDAYLQRRRSVIFEGNPPDEDGVDKLSVQPDPAPAPAPADALTPVNNNSGLPLDQKAIP
jgi:phospholipid-binding lipoprotein MlaA